VATIDVEIKDLDNLARRVDQMPMVLRRAASRGLDSAAIEVETAAKKNFKGKKNPFIRSPDIHVRSGTTRRAIKALTEAEQHGRDILRQRIGYREGLTGTRDKRYVYVIENRGETVIKPRLRKVLAIPLPAALTPAGVPKFGSPRDVPDGHWITREGKPPLFIKESGRKMKGGHLSRSDMLFVGLPSVKVKGRRPLGRAFNDTRQKQIRLIRKEIDQAKAEMGF
jgi:hypothetical protein